MEYVIKDRQPAAVFRYFEKISAIPRASYHEEKIADYLVEFATRRGLNCYRDNLHNVLIDLPATPGWQSKPAILLQGHTDMVCEKNSDTVHDFSKDPLKLYVDGGFLRAKGTTLGADNGIAVAMMLAVLNGEISEHPAIQCLFTTAEEVGLNGAHGFDYSRIFARRMLNLDSEELGVVTAGCAGGVRTDLTMTPTTEPFHGECVRVFIEGLAGGHSGENINSGRANANKVMGRLLAALRREMPVWLVSANGGSKDNAIPRECEVLLSVQNGDSAIVTLTETAALVAKELSGDDRNFKFTAESAFHDAEMLTLYDSDRMIALVASVQNGVREMNHSVKGLVECSRNLGIWETDTEHVKLVLSTRSGMESRLDASTDELDALARSLGLAARHYSRYPGWDFAKRSPVREKYLAAYRAVTGEDARVNVIHAGLECGIISSNLPEMDMISIGPSMRDIHSPDEALDLSSVEVFWRTLEEMLKS